MLAAGRSFPVATTVHRASARTAATGRAWRATPASFPGNNVRGLSSEGTPGTVAGAQAAGATPPPTPPLRGGGSSSGGGGSGGGSGGDGGGGGGVGGAAVKVVVLTAAVVGANMAAYAKVPAVKKMVDEKLEGPLPPEVYDIYRRCGVDVSPPYWKIRSEREAWDFGVMRKIKEEARRLSPFNSNNSAKPTERSKGGGFEIDTSGITKKGFSVSSRADDNEDKNAAATAAITTLPTTTATTTTTTEPTELVTREQGPASSPSPWERRDSSSPAPLPSNASNAAETAGGDDDGDWEAGAAAALAEAEAADNLAVAAVPEGGGSSSAADAADSAPSSAREARAAVVPLAGDGGKGSDGTGGGEIADSWEQEAGSAAAASAAVDAAAAADAAGDVSAVTADVVAGGDAAGVVEVGTAAAAEEEEEAVAVRELESKKRRIRNEALSKVAEEMEVASAGLKRELEHSMLKDLKELDEDSLRFRVAQLATEMQESAKWESLRLMDGVKKMEAEIARKYETLLSEQKELYRSETGKALREQEEELAATFMEDYNKQLRYHLEHQANEFKEALHASATAGQDALRDELESKHADEVDALKAEELKNAEAVLREVKDLSQKTEETLTVLEAARIAEEADKAASETVHRVTHATLALAEHFAGSGPIGPELDNLLRLSGGDPLLEAAAGSIPRAAASKGISTVPQLRQRFGVVKKECRRAALMPEGAGGGLFGYLMASVLAKITFVPKGMMDGEGAEVALARADHLLEAGELKSAVGEVEKLSGLPADVAEDWLRDAKTRLIADEALRVFRCHASLLNAKQIAHLDRKA